MNIVKLVILFCDHCVLLCNKCAKCMGLYFSCFWMSSLDAFSPRLYVFVVCSICRRKKVNCSGGAFDPFCSLWTETWWDSLVCYFFVTSFIWFCFLFQTLKLRRYSVNKILSLMSHTKCWSYRTWTGWNIWRYYPSLDQIQSIHHKRKIKARYCSVTLLLAKLLGAENPTGEIVYICFLLLKVQTFLSISLFSFLGKKKSQCSYFFSWKIVYIVYDEEKNVFLLFVFDCSNAYCLQPLNHKTKNGQFAHMQVLILRFVTLLDMLLQVSCHGITVHNSLTGQSAFLEF